MEMNLMKILIQISKKYKIKINQQEVVEEAGEPLEVAEVKVEEVEVVMNRKNLKKKKFNNNNKSQFQLRHQKRRHGVKKQT
jgi:hypothetical protein